ncbi:hypothetical protein HPP92_003284 [Vanilla planifolia]|uniref:Uncharacterized protein n=1 Tax=Vanilla planifolia TaxID=51239 RepID=A0A835VIR6_VANPL|nr:hypothetical protein HPP92_003284 [Vanilla planifolia]
MSTTRSSSPLGYASSAGKTNWSPLSLLFPASPHLPPSNALAPPFPPAIPPMHRRTIAPADARRTTPLHL